jgi:hypothetical protein
VSYKRFFPLSIFSIIEALKRRRQMNPKYSTLFVYLALLTGVFGLASQVNASEQIALVYSFKGEVIIQSGTEVFRLTQAAFSLKDGDRIQTKDGEVTVKFSDGAIMKIRPFSNIVLQEREEKGGFWIFKTKRAVRRITCFIGKLWFKSGISKRRNYLQTPTAICGVRGSELEGGYNNVDSLLNVISGIVDKVGLWKEGTFAEPGPAAAFKSRVYQSVAKAISISEKAKTTKKAVDLAKAQAEILRVIMEAARELQKNPDTALAREAQVVANVTGANIAAVEAAVAVEQLIEAGAPDAEVQNAQAAADSAQAQAASANEAANAVYEEGVFDPGRLDAAIEETETYADSAQSFAEEATAIAEEVAPPEEAVPEEEAPPEEITPEEEAPAEEAAPEEVAPEEAPPEEIPIEVPPQVPLPDTETPEQEVYQEEASPSQ